MAHNESLAARTHAGHGDFMVVRRTTSDVLEQADALPFWTQDYTQLSKGEFAGAVIAFPALGEVMAAGRGLGCWWKATGG